MFAVYANDVNISEYIEFKSVKITEQLNNRAKICSFISNTYEVTHSSVVEVFEVLQLTAQALSGQAVLKVADTYEFYDNFQGGDEIILDIKWAGQTKATILSVDHSAKTITLTANLSSTLAKTVLCWRLVFAGTVESVPNEELWYLEEFSYKVTVTDWIARLNRKNVVDAYETKYMREIISRIVYGFCVNDMETVLDTFESAWTQSGVALAMADETTDRIVWSKAQKTGTSGAGTAKWTKTISTADISAMTHIRLRYKIKYWLGADISSMKYRVWNDSSNYYERSSDRIGVENDWCWNYIAFLIADATVVWTVNEAAIDWLQIEVVCTDAMASDALIFDQTLTSSWWFTLQNTIRWDVEFQDYRVSYKKPSETFEDLAKRQGFFWYVDYERDIHVFRMNNLPAPFDLDDTSENYWELTFEVDRSMLRNRQTVIGWVAPSTSLYTQDTRADGAKTSRPLDYKPKDLSAYVATQDFTITGATRLAWVITFTTSGAHGFSVGDEIAVTDVVPALYNGSYTVISTPLSTTFTVALVWNPWAYSSWWKVWEFIQKTTGIENIDDAASFNYLYNFNEKIIKNGNATLLPNGAVIRVTYYAYQSIRVRGQDPTSIAAIKLLENNKGDGIYDWPVINDNTILTFADARRRVNAELEAYSNPITSVKFKTNKAWLHAWQIIHVTNTPRGVDSDFLIQKITRTSINWAKSSYAVECWSTMFGLIEFFQLLLKKTNKLGVDSSELVDVVINEDDTITITFAVNFTTKSNVFQAWAIRSTKKWDFVANTGTKSSNGVIWNKQRYAAMTANAAVMWFDTASNYNTGSSMYINISSADAGEYASIRTTHRFPMDASQLYTLSWRIENLMSWGLVWWSGLTISIIEYAAKRWGSPLQTTNLVSWHTDYHDFEYYDLDFTTHASTQYADILVKVIESTGKVSISDLRLQDPSIESASNPWVADFCEASQWRAYLAMYSSHVAIATRAVRVHEY